MGGKAAAALPPAQTTPLQGGRCAVRACASFRTASWFPSCAAWRMPGTLPPGVSRSLEKKPKKLAAFLTHSRLEKWTERQRTPSGFGPGATGPQPRLTLEEVPFCHCRRRESMSDVFRTPAESGGEPLEHEVEQNLLIQQALNAVLHIALEPISLDEQMHRVLGLILKLPWLALEG